MTSISIDVDRKVIVHCVFDDNDTNTKVLAANDRNLAQNIISNTIYATSVVGLLFDGTWPAHHMTV